MEPDRPQDDAWSSRERYWRRKLGRLKLGVEPLDVQLNRYRRVTWMLTAVPLGITIIFVSLFSAFHRPDVGIIIASVLLLPIVVFAWIDYGMLRLRAAGYARELREYESREQTARPSPVE